MIDVAAYKSKKKELGITFEELSKLSGVPVQTLHNIFRGHTTTPRIDTVRAIERALVLYTERNANSVSEQKEKAPQEYPAGLTSDERILLDYYRRLVPSNKLTVFNLLKSVFKEAKDLPVELVSDYINAYYN